MAALAARKVDYAFFPIDGQYNMGPQEAMACAAMVCARHNTAIHWFNADPAQFCPKNNLPLHPGTASRWRRPRPAKPRPVGRRAEKRRRGRHRLRRGLSGLRKARLAFAAGLARRRQRFLRAVGSCFLFAL